MGCDLIGVCRACCVQTGGYKEDTGLHRLLVTSPEQTLECVGPLPPFQLPADED
jgi:hypothetical protein